MCVFVCVCVCVCVKCLQIFGSWAGHRNLADKDSGIRMTHGNAF